MKQRLVRWIVFFLAAVLILPLFPVSALPAAPEAPEIDCKAGAVFNLEKESFLYEKNMEERIEPASFAKLMTALLAYEYRAASGNVSVTVTEEMLDSVGGTTIRLQAGEILTLDDLLLGMTVANANDAAQVLAIVVGGSIPAFVELMNRRARELGMLHTYYANPTGVDAPMMYTTLGDTVLLCRAVYRVNDFMVDATRAQAILPATNKSAQREYTNKNALIPFSYVTDYYLKGVQGMTAGYTTQAGHCLATVREKNGCTNLVVLSGGTDYSENRTGMDISSYRDAKALLEWAEGSFSVRKLLEQGQILCEREVRLSSGSDHVLLVASREVEMLLPNTVDPATALTMEISTLEEIFSAPIIEGDAYGKVDLYLAGEWIDTVSLVAQRNVPRSSWLTMWSAVEGFFSQGPARVVLILAIIAAVLYVLLLVFTVWLHWMRRNRARRQAIEEITQQEDQRLRQVRLKEKKEQRARIRRAKSFLRVSFGVLSGDSELLEKSDPHKEPQPRKAVAKVPEQYRRHRDATSKKQGEGSTPAAPRADGREPREPGQRGNSTRSPRRK